MKNVLVFPCGSEIGLELHRSLASSTHFRLFGASSIPDHGRFAYLRYHEIPEMADDPGFADAFNRLLRELDIDYVLPAHDSVVVKLAEMQDAGALAAEAVVPNHDVCSICRSKQATYRLLADVAEVPRVYGESELGTAPFPLFAKPDVGQGSRGAVILPDAQAAREKLRREPGSVVMEYLPGPEYTVDCFTNAAGALLFQSARGRNRVSGGISVSSRQAVHPSLAGMAVAINDRLALRGAWFFQARENASGEAVLLEVAPRIAGGSGFQRARGVNLPLLSLFDRMGVPVTVPHPGLEGLEMDRALAASYRPGVEYGTAYLDFDDTIRRRDGTLDTTAVKFLFQCRNRGVRLVLLTRHAGDIAAALAECRLTGVFDRVVCLGAGEGKAEHIAETPAVFVDDSFSERAAVAGKPGVAVFDPSSLEALLDDRG